MAKSRKSRNYLSVDVTDEIQGKYASDALVLLGAHHVHVCNWRNNNSGVAYHLKSDPKLRAIEAPHPIDENHFATLAHEVGHQVNGNLKPVWYGEELAWEFAFKAMERLGIPITPETVNERKMCMRQNFVRAFDRGLFPVPRTATQYFDKHELGLWKDYSYDQYKRRQRTRDYNRDWWLDDAA